MRMTWIIYFQLLQHYNWTLPVVEGRLLTLGHFQGYKEKGHKGVKKKGGEMLAIYIKLYKGT